MSVPPLGIIKLSVLSFYRRIFVIEKRNARNGHNMLYVLLTCIISFWVGGFALTFIFACRGHFSAWWTSAFSLMTKYINTLELLFAFAVSDFILDALVIILPIPVIWKLHLPMDRKLGVLFIFLLGALAVIASLIRMIWVIWSRQVGFDESLDQNLLITTLLFWSMIEALLGIIASCLPTLRGLFKPRSVESFLGSIKSKFSVRAWKTQSSDSLQLSEGKGKRTFSRIDDMSV